MSVALSAWQYAVRSSTRAQEIKTDRFGLARQGYVSSFCLEAYPMGAKPELVVFFCGFGCSNVRSSTFMRRDLLKGLLGGVNVHFGTITENENEDTMNPEVRVLTKRNN